METCWSEIRSRSKRAQWLVASLPAPDVEITLLIKGRVAKDTWNRLPFPADVVRPRPESPLLSTQKSLFNQALASRGEQVIAVEIRPWIAIEPVPNV